MKNPANATIPIVSIETPVSLGEWETELSGSVSAGNENYEIIQKGFIISLTPGEMQEVQMPEEGEMEEYGEFSFTHYEMEPGLTFYIRAFAINAIGIGYSEEIVFEVP